MLNQKVTNFYRHLLHLYPSAYQRRFNTEMLTTFNDLYHDEVKLYGKIKPWFLLEMTTDTILNIINEHFFMIKKHGLLNYLHFNRYHLLGGILLSPFITLLSYDLIGRLVQGDLFHYNRAFYYFISHTFLYANYFGRPYLLWLIIVLAPIIAIIINLLPFIFLIVNIKQNNFSRILFSNFITFIIIFTGLLALLIVYGHDFFPCFIQAIYHRGLQNIFNIISICQKA
ncbi:hypothetical protein M1116_01455 [Patescibacteria group bacterium]|nr:hypothetical protein [Patescibacteria group bacterium]